MTGPEKSRPRVAILLATYNGEDDLPDQLRSYAEQTLQPACILVSDDGSTDDTLAVLQHFAQQHPELDLRLTTGPGRGSAANFLSLLAATPQDVDYIAFSDQDDVWLPEKLALGTAALKDHLVPALYCARTWECDADLGNRRLSRGAPLPVTFRNALVQNVAAGNTILLNRPAIDVALKAVARTQETVVHDWWCYQLITGCGGVVVFDDSPVLLYRQHAGNQIGANRGLAARLLRLSMVWRGRLKEWNDINLLTLMNNIDLLTPENRDITQDFARAREAGPMRRLGALLRHHLYRQGRLGQASLVAAALLGKL